MYFFFYCVMRPPLIGIRESYPFAERGRHDNFPIIPIGRPFLVLIFSVTIHKENRNEKDKRCLERYGQSEQNIFI